MEIEEMLKIFRELEESESGREFLEFASDLNELKSKFYNQSNALCEHVIKLQLYNDTTAGQTIYDITFNLWGRCRGKKAQRYLDYSLIHECLIEHTISDKEEYGTTMDFIYEETHETYYRVYYRKDFDVFNKVADLCINTILEFRHPDRKEFYKKLNEVLG